MIEIPKDIAEKVYDVSMFFKQQGITNWAYYDLCSRSFADAEAERLTKEYKKHYMKESSLAAKRLGQLKKIWEALDPMFNTQDKW